MSCELCDEIGPELHDKPPTHKLIIEWRRFWAGPEGWARKRAIADAKRQAREMMKRKKPQTP